MSSIAVAVPASPSAEAKPAVQSPKVLLPLLHTDRVDFTEQVELIDFGEPVLQVPCSSSLVQQ